MFHKKETAEDGKALNLTLNIDNTKVKATVYTIHQYNLLLVTFRTIFKLVSHFISSKWPSHSITYWPPRFMTLHT